MPVIGKVELISKKDVNAGTETRLRDILPSSESKKELTLESDVARDTKLKIVIPKLGTIDTVADVNKKKEEKTSLWELTKIGAWGKKVKASENIKKGDGLSVTIETV